MVLNVRGREFWSNCRFVNILFWKAEHDSNVCGENEISELNFKNINQTYRTQNSCPLKYAVVVLLFSEFDLIIFFENTDQQMWSQ